MLYLAMVHGFFSDEFLGKKGGKGKAKDLWHLWSCFEKLTAIFCTHDCSGVGGPPGNPSQMDGCIYLHQHLPH